MPMGKVTRLQPGECPPGANRHARDYFATVLRRLDWLSQQIRTAPPRPGGDFRLQEFDALTWLLAQVVGQELVDRWMGKYEIEVPGWRPCPRPSEPVAPGGW